MKQKIKKNKEQTPQRTRRRNIDLDKSFDDEIKIINAEKKKEEERRSKRRGKTYTQVVEENKQKERLKSGLKAFSTCFLIIFVIFLLYMYIEYGAIFGISIFRNSKIENAKKIDIVSTDQDIYRAYNSKIIVYSNQVVKMYNNSGKEKFNFKLPEAFIPQIYNNNSYMMIVNKNKGIIYFFEDRNEILDKKIDGTISNVYIDDIGNFAIEYEATGYKKVIGVYNKLGDNLYNAYLDSNAIVDIKLLNTGKKLIVAQVTTDSLTAGISIKQIEASKTDDIKEIINIKNATLYNLTITGQHIIMLLDSKIVSYDMDTLKQTTIKSFDKMQVSFVNINPNYYSIIEDKSNLSLTTDHNYVFETSDFASQSIGNISLNNIPKYIKSNKYLTCLVYQDKLQVINRWSKSIKQLDIFFPPKDVILFNNEKSLALIYSNKIYIINI